METSITWFPKHTVRLSLPQLPLHIRLMYLLIAGGIIGLFSMTVPVTSAFAKSYTPASLNYTPIPLANIAFASTQGAPIEQHAQKFISYTYTPSSITDSTGNSLNADIIFQKINAIRQQNGFPAFQQDSRLCTLASSRAPEIPNEIATGTMHHGMYARNLPYWNNENIIDINSEDAAVNWWMNDYIHRIAILGDYTYSCVACSGNACAEEFSNFSPKE